MIKVVKFLVYTLLSLAVGLTIGLLITFTTPQEWYGSCFEGSCGYVAMIIGILIGFGLTPIFLVLLYWQSRKWKQRGKSD